MNESTTDEANSSIRAAEHDDSYQFTAWESLGPFSVLLEESFSKELQKMIQLRVPGSKELYAESQRIKALVLAQCTVEERLCGLTPEQRVSNLSAAEKVQLLKFLQEDVGR